MRGITSSGIVLALAFSFAGAELARPGLNAATQGASARAVVRAVEARYRRAATLRAAFYERYSDGKGGAVSESGTVYFAKPGRMRWEYDSPQEKLFIVDGKNVWFYVPADHAASRAKLRESSDWRTPIALLAGKADLGKICRNVDLVDASSGSGSGGSKPNSASTEGQGKELLYPQDSLLRCTPRVSSDESGQVIRDILLEADPEAHLVRVIVEQPGNVQTEFRFGNWQENIAIPEVKFHFQAPPGVAIVDEESLAGQIY